MFSSILTFFLAISTLHLAVLNFFSVSPYTIGQFWPFFQNCDTNSQLRVIKSDLWDTILRTYQSLFHLRTIITRNYKFISHNSEKKSLFFINFFIFYSVATTRKKFRIASLYLFISRNGEFISHNSEKNCQINLAISEKKVRISSLYDAILRKSQLNLVLWV